MAKEKTDNEPKKRFLRSYGECARRAIRIKNEIRELRAMKMNPSVKQSDGMPHGSGTSDLSSYAARLDQMLTELDQEEENKEEAYKRVCKQIELLEDKCEVDLLRYRYINQYDWYVIADIMGYSLRHTHRIHGDALKHFQLPKDVTRCHTA